MFTSRKNDTRAAGFFLRVVMLLVLLATSASAASITNIAGNYDITGATWDNGQVNVVGRNLLNGNRFTLIGSTYTEIQADPSWIDFGLLGVFNGYAAGNAITANGDVVGVSFAGSAVLSIYDNYQFFGSGPNGAIGGIEKTFGNAFHATLNGAGVLANIQVIPRTGNEDSGDVRGVAGSLSAGLYGSNGNSLSAFIADGGVRRNIDVGYYSVGYGVDPITNSGFGGRNLEAVEWLPDGTMLFFNDPSTGQRIRGDVISGFGGLRIIKSEGGALFVSDGKTVMTFVSYMLGLGSPLSYTPSVAWFIGDPNTREMALVFPGSIRAITADINYFASPLRSAGGNEIPEPGSLILVGTAIGAYAANRFRKQCAVS
jgi:hypothetical protein